jgi:hypothetical protein
MLAMSDARDRLKDLEREVRETAAAERAALEKVPPPAADAPKKKRTIRRRTKQKILAGTALALALLLVWKKVNIQFVVFTSFWGFMGILLGVFFVIYLVLRFFFAQKDE